MNSAVTVEGIQKRIFLLREQKIMLDPDLAELYGVETKTFNRAVKRNRDRFPDDFMFQLRREEYDDLKSHFGTSSWGGRRYMPYAFTEHGVVMLSSVLTSERAIQMNIAIVRAFVRLRELLANNKDLANRLEQLEHALDQHTSVINILADEINNLKAIPDSPRRQIGFRPED